MRSVPHALELLLFGALTIAAAATAQTPTSASTPDPQKADPLSFSKDVTVIEDLQVKVRFENDGKAVYETSLRAKIQSESAVRNNGLIAFSYFASNETLDIKYVRVRKPDGTLVETPLDSIQDLTSDVARSAPMYTDQHEKHIAVKGLSVGDTLEYRTVSTVIKPLAPGQFWFSHNFSKQTLTLHELLEINVPKDRAVRVLSPGNSPVVSEDGTRRIYTFQSSHLKKDPDPDKWEQALNGDPSPEVQLSSFATWDEVAAWYGTLQKPSMQVTPEIRAKAEELTRGKNTDTEKIRALYDYVSSKFRYISISLGQGRYAPHAASEVLANQFGDCKDKHTLLAALLQAVGIDAYPVLISSSMKIDSATPTPGLFDHVITAVPQKDSFLLLDTTPGVAPFALLSRPLRDKLALVVSPGNKGLLIKTPVDPPFPFFQHFTMTATLDSGGTLEGKARVEVRGDAELLLRGAFRDTPQSGWKELAQAYSAASGFGGTVDDVSAADSSDTSAPFWFTYSYHRPEYGDWPNHRIILPFPRMGLPELTKEETQSAATFPLGPQQELTYEARLTLPKDLWPSLIPPIQEKRDFADYQSSYALEDRVLHGTRHLRLTLQEIPGAKRPQYVSLYKAVDEDERRWINLLGATTPPASPSTSSEAQHFFDEGSRSIQLGAPWAATTSLERAVKLDPSWFDAWLLLGDARLMASRPEPAVEAYRKAISLDPSNIRGYETLSKSLISLHRTEDAVLVWHDLLKVIPDNLEASENLAMLLAASAKYAEARPVLEKAIEHGPENPSLRFQLGCTYIQLGLEDQASEQFQKAMELRPDPEMRSAIAYALAEAKRHLPDALRYAEEAVQETEARTSSIDLSPSAMKEGYSLMGHLAAEWDTLGWVNFRLGNLTAAEKYAVAAWKLSQLPSIGDHLGQIYEKQGKKIQALHTFGLALAALPAEGDPKLREKLLSRMTASGSQSSSWERNKKEVEDMRSFSLKRIGEKDESAFFAVVSTNDSEVAEVKFLNGPEELREAEPAIAAIKFSTVFPDATPIRIFRGGTLSCNQLWTGCRFTLLPYPPRILFPPQAQ